MPWRYTRSPCVCVYDAYLLSIGAIIQYEWCAMCVSWGRWMSVCGCSQMRLLSHCLPQRQMVCQCSSRNRAHTDWWESSALGVPCMQMEPPLSQCAIIKMNPSFVTLSPPARPRFLLLTVFSLHYSQRWPQPGVQETSQWTSQRSAPLGSVNFPALRAKTSLSWPATEASSQLVSRELISKWLLFHVRLMTDDLLV